MLRPLQLEHIDFILELLNSPGWLRFIGNRNVGNAEQAVGYIHGLNTKPGNRAWVAYNEAEQPAGLITLMRRDYLDCPDLGYAFLPAFHGKGYATAACREAESMIKNEGESKLYAITLPENHASVRLLEKIGFVYKETLQRELPLDLFEKLL